MRSFTIAGRVGQDLVVGPDHQRLMGILNVTPDSFSDGNRYPTVHAAVTAAIEMEAAGAHVLDIGGESSRPGARTVSADEEMERVLPVLESLRSKTRLPISIDTRKARVAQAALELGADWINDISALGDPAMGGVVARSGAGLVLLHMQGEPATMQRAPRYDDPLAEVTGALRAAAARATAAGVDRGQILIDPGIGFGKSLEHNLALLRGLDTLCDAGFPVVLGASRKSFLGQLTAAGGEPAPPAERDAATLAVLARAHAAGVSVHRVHNVGYAMDALRTLDGIGRK